MQYLANESELIELTSLDSLSLMEYIAWVEYQKQWKRRDQRTAIN